MDIFTTILASSGDSNVYLYVLIAIGLIAIFTAAYKIGTRAGSAAGQKAVVSINDEALQKIKDKYGDKIRMEGTCLETKHYFFTQDEFFMQMYGDLFKSYPLRDIHTIEMRETAEQNLYELFLYDSNRNCINPKVFKEGNEEPNMSTDCNLPAMKKEEAESLQNLIFSNIQLNTLRGEKQ